MVVDEVIGTPLSRSEILQEALRLTMGDRNEAYGDPVENHQHIADIFRAWTGVELTATQVAQLQVCTKLARITTSPTKADSYVDASAYLGISAECTAAGK